MILLHNIGPRVNGNYNTREEILACDEPLSFDGVYLSVWENADVLIGKNVTLFVMGDHVGKDNSFDVGMPFERYCDWNQIMDLVSGFGCKLGWHTRSHPDLTKVDDERLMFEVTPPFPMEHFAYPYGKLDARVMAAVERAGFKDAYSVHDGGTGRFDILRRYLNW